MNREWTRIPAPITTDADRRALCAILAASGLEVRLVRDRKTKNGAYQRYVEFRAEPVD